MNTLNKNLLAALGLASALTLGASPALAYETSSCGGYAVRWAGNSCYFRVDTGSMSSSLRSAFQQAMNAWNATPASFSFSMSSTSLWNPFTGNVQNEAWMSSDQDILDGALAVCISWNACATRMEADIVFDSGVSWTTGTSKSVMTAYGGSSFPFRSVAIHELGHALCLRHEAGTYNVMGDAATHLQTNGSTALSYAGEDATDGAIYLYGIGNASRQDVAVSHWRRTGSWQGYSTHGRTRIFINGVEASKYGSGAEPTYYVRRGDTVELEMSYENNGASSQGPRLHFFVSTNDFISTSDQLIGSRTITVNRNEVYTARHAVTIPANLQAWTNYWLGVKIDADGQISEFDESNNASYIAIRVRT